MAQTGKRRIGCLTVYVISALVCALVAWIAHDANKRTQEVNAKIERLWQREASRVTLERREDVLRARAALEATKSGGISNEAFRNNAAVTLWLLGDAASAAELIASRSSSAYEDGMALTAHVVTADPAFDKPSKSATVEAQRAYNNAATTVDVLMVTSTETDLSPRLRAKILVRLGIERAKALRSPTERKATLSESTAFFREAKALDPDGAIGQMADENVRRLEVWAARTARTRRK